LAVFAESTLAIQQGFNYGSTNNDYSCRKYENFHSMFTRAKILGQSGFTSARLYTNVQCGSDNAPIEG
jgi:glucan endo-1,3-beta-D-glucosidase